MADAMNSDVTSSARDTMRLHRQLSGNVHVRHTGVTSTINLHPTSRLLNFHYQSSRRHSVLSAICRMVCHSFAKNNHFPVALIRNLKHCMTQERKQPPPLPPLNPYNSPSYPHKSEKSPTYLKNRNKNSPQMQ